MAATPRSKMSSGGNYYEVLGVPFEASEEDIKLRYRSIVRTLHPDRRRPGDEVTERFHQVQSAWRCLSDTTRRLLYDLRNFGRSSLGDRTEHGGGGVLAEEKLVGLQKEQALRDVDNMQVALAKVLRRERKARGVVVRAALYGDLRLREDCLEECSSGRRTISREDLVGPTLEVSAPLQCLVEQHTLMLPGGAAASKADLPGFYNPTPLSNDLELSLYVLYEFKGSLHEILVGDREALSVPRRGHAILPGREPRGPFSPANVMLLRQQRAAAPSAGGAGGRAQERSAMAFQSAPPRQALATAVAKYILDGLMPPHALGEATPSELLMVLGAAALLSGAAWLSCRRA